MADAFRMPAGQLVTNLRDEPVFNSFTLNQSTDKFEVVFQSEEDITCTRVGLRIGTITGSVTWRIGLQGVDTSNNPNGTWLGGGTPANATFNPTSLGWASGDWRWVTLDNSVSLTRGTAYAFVMEYSSGTLGSQAVSCNGLHPAGGGFPICITNDNGSRSRITNGIPIFGYGSSTKVYGNPMETLTTHSYTSDSSPDEFAVAFNIPTQFCSTYKIRGIEMGAFRIATLGQTWTMTLYSGTTALQQIQLDSDLNPDRFSHYNYKFYFDETTLSTLNAGSTYRIGFAPDNASISLVMYSYNVDAAADFDAYPWGQNFWASNRVNAGAWTDVTTRRFNCNLILDDITAPSGGAAGGSVIIGNGGPIIRGLY